MAATLGAVIYRPLNARADQAPDRLPFLAQALIGCGVHAAYELVAEVLEAASDRIPRLEFPGAT